MDGREQLLRLQIDTCPEGAELAGLLTELAGLHIAAVSSQHCFPAVQLSVDAQLKNLVRKTLDSNFAEQNLCFTFPVVCMHSGPHG
jgi:hypothetical protein